MSARPDDVGGSEPGARKLVFDSGLVTIDDPRITALHEGYDDLVKVFAKPFLPRVRRVDHPG